MSKSFEIIIATPERVVYRDVAESITLPTTEGEITVLPGHVPLSTILQPGELIIRHNSTIQPYAVSGGFVEVQAQKIVVLADTAEHIEEIDEQRAQEAITRAEKLKTEIKRDHVEFAGLAAKLDRDLNRLKIVRKYRHRGHQGIDHEAVRHD